MMIGLRVCDPFSVLHHPDLLFAREVVQAVEVLVHRLKAAGRDHHLQAPAADHQETAAAETEAIIKIFLQFYS